VEACCVGQIALPVGKLSAPVGAVDPRSASLDGDHCELLVRVCAYEGVTADDAFRGMRVVQHQAMELFVELKDFLPLADVEASDVGSFFVRCARGDDLLEPEGMDEEFPGLMECLEL
jgi:hypothetical protein